MTLLILALTFLCVALWAYVFGEHLGWRMGFKAGVELERRLHVEARAARAPAKPPVSSESDLLLSDFLIFDTPRLRH